MTERVDTSPKQEVLWHKIVLKYTQPDLRKSIWQLCNSFIPYVFFWFLMYKSLQYSYVYTLLLSVVASGFLVRLFIIFHDCGHGSFFKSATANRIVGKFTGILALTPYHKWHDTHHIHHTTTANLDKRGIGDVWTMTVKEYLDSSPGRRLLYRCFRNPFFMFLVGPLLLILFNRVTKKKMTRQGKMDVYLTNLAVLAMAAVISYFIGIKAYLMIQLPIIILSHTVGLWLFYIQHQFEDVEWDRSERWDYKTAAIQGSSFLKLHPVLQWFTGNIGFHHVHHLSSRIPNYNLARCHYENELFRDIKPIELLSTFKALRLHLWDEASRRLIRFSEIAATRPVTV